MQRGFSLIEVLIVVFTLFVIAGMMVPAMKSAMLRAHVGAMASDAKSIHVAFKRHFVDRNEYPNAINPPAFELDSFEPLVSDGYYDGRILGKLLGDTADDYDSPDDEGVNQEFWLELTLKHDPSIRFVVADSDNAPLAGGEDLDGIYMYKDGVLTPLTSPVDKK